jgi:dihydrofolate reductase
MRKLILQVQITLDGFIGGPNGEMDFMTFNWDDELNNYVKALMEPVDAIVLGRKLAEGFIPYWAGVAADEANPQQEAGKAFTNLPKVVFTKMLQQPAWDNTVLAKGDVTEEINILKQQTGGSIIAYGGAAFVSSLIQHNLIDEYHLMVNPVAIGKGLSIFGELSGKLDLSLINTRTFSCGITVLHYRPKA